MKKLFESTYFKWGVTLTIVLCISILFSKALASLQDLSGWREAISVAFEPVVMGFVIAFLVNPIMKLFQKLFTKLFGKFIKNEDSVAKISKGIAVTLAMISFLAFIAVILWLLIPQLYDSIIYLYKELPTYIDNTTAFVTKQVNENPLITESVGKYWESFTTSLTKFFSNDIIPNITQYASNVTDGITDGLRMLFNFFVGLVVAIYFLLEKENLIAILKKTVYAIFDKRRGNMITQGIAYVNQVFGEYITGKILDSIIVGVICFIFCKVANIPYAILISVVIGVTNIVPFFGPCIGAVPCALLVLAVNPKLCIVFLIGILVIQQTDGNVIGPLVLGDSTGISGFWVLCAILVCGKLFGFFGMVLSVPMVACIYTLIGLILQEALKRKGIESDTAFFLNLRGFDADGNAIYGDMPKKPHKPKMLGIVRLIKRKMEESKVKVKVEDTVTEENETDKGNDVSES